MSDKVTATRATTSPALLLVAMVTGHAIKHVFNAGFFVVLPELKAGLDLSNAGIGTMSTVRNVAGGLTNLPAGFVADRYPRRAALILALSMVLIGVFLFALGRAGSYRTAVLFATLMAVSVAFWHPTALGAIARVYTQRRGFAIALHGTGGSIGEAVGPVLTGTLLVAMSWRTLLEVSLVPAVVAGGLVLVVLRAGVAGPAAVHAAGYLRSFAGLLRNRKLLIVLIIAGGYAASQSAITTFLPIYVREDLDKSPWVVGAYISLAQVVGIGAQPLMGHLSDRVGRKAVLVPSLLGFGLCLMGLYAAGSGVLFVLALAATGAFLFSTIALVLAAAADLVGEELQSTVVSLVYMALIFLSALSPLVGGLVADAFDVRQVFLYASSIALATGLLAGATRWQRS